MSSSGTHSLKVLIFIMIHPHPNFLYQDMFVSFESMFPFTSTLPQAARPDSTTISTWLPPPILIRPVLSIIPLPFTGCFSYQLHCETPTVPQVIPPTSQNVPLLTPLPPTHTHITYVPQRNCQHLASQLIPCKQGQKIIFINLSTNSIFPPCYP